METYEGMRERAIKMFGADGCKRTANWIHDSSVFDGTGAKCGLPVCVIRDTEAPEDLQWWYSSDVTITVEDVLDLNLDGFIQINWIPEDRRELEENLRYNMEDEFAECDDGTFDRLVKDVMETYESHWVKCLVIRAAY